MDEVERFRLADEQARLLGDDAMLRPLKVSELLDISPRTLEAWRRRGRGPKWSKIGGRPVMFLGDLRAWLRNERLSKGICAN